MRCSLQVQRPLLKAAFQCDDQGIEAALKNGASVNVGVCEDAPAALFCVLPLARPAADSSEAEEWQTPMKRHTEAEQLPALEVLLRAKADVALRSAGAGPLHFAEGKATTEALILAKADVNGHDGPFACNPLL